MNDSIKNDKERFDRLYESVLECGLISKKRQSSVNRSIKEDGSPVTEADLEISHILIGKIRELFPDEWIISEEEEVKNSDLYRYIFAIDPIDGTDVYSQGLPSYAVSVGVLNRGLEPVGAFISCPRFGIAKDALNVRLDPDGELYIDGEILRKREEKNSSMQLTMGSKCFKNLSFSTFKGKVRTFGSTIIHLLLPAIMPSFIGALSEPCYLWDILSSHAVLRHLGMDILYINGEKFEYTEDFVFKRKRFLYPIIAADDQNREYLQSVIKERL